MKVRLRNMSLREFETFREYSTNSYAKDLIKNQNISLESALKQVFLNDLLIYEEERRKGYAMAALSEMVHNAAEAGCRQSIIYVWKHNPSGVNLYTKCGYVAFRELDDGMYMKKEIG